MKFLEDPRWSKTIWLSELAWNVNSIQQNLINSAWALDWVAYRQWLDRFNKGSYTDEWATLKYLSYMNWVKETIKQPDRWIIYAEKKRIAKNLIKWINNWSINWFYEWAKQVIKDKKTWNKKVYWSLEIYLNNDKLLVWLHFPLNDKIVPNKLNWWQWLEDLKNRHWI